MKKLLVSTLILGLAAGVSGAAWAQDDHHDDKDKTHAMAGQGDGAKADADKDRHDDKKADKAATDTTKGDADKSKIRDKKTRTRNVDTTRNGDSSTRTDRDTTTNTRTNPKTGDTRSTRHVDVTSYRKTVTSSRHFHAGAYHAPRGYSYRRYSIGERLDAQFYARDYWLSDFAAYDLIAPPDGYVWVRFGPDALLIDEDTGETIQVVYGVFD